MNSKRRLVAATMTMTMTMALAGACAKTNGGAPPNNDGSMSAMVDAARADADAAGSSRFEPAVNTLPFNDGVYFVAKWSAGIGLQRFWPTRATSFYTGFDLGAQQYYFRPSDWQLFYGNSAIGIYIDDSPTAADTRISTPPCLPQQDSPFLTDFVDTRWGFDGQGRFYYSCQGRRRGNGEKLPGQQAGFVGVLADGRSVVEIEDANGDPNTLRFAAMAPDGRILSELDLGFPPYFLPNADSITIQGNDAFVLLTRIEYDANMEPYDAELVGYRLDPQSRWLKVRSVPYVRLAGYWDLLLSDGTILSWSVNQPDAGSQVIAFLPDGTQRVVWHEADSPGAYYPATQLIVGPREPTGPSVHPE